MIAVAVLLAATTAAFHPLAEQGVLFARTYCVFPLSGPSHNSIFTGLYPQHVRWKPYRSNPSCHLGRYLLDAGDESHHRIRHSDVERLRRYSDGVTPTYFRNTWLKYWLDEKPVARAMSVMLRSVSCRSSRACWMRRRTR